MILKIKNFQSWEDLELEFSDGVTQIIGPSNSGKSAIFRALVLLMENKPRNKSFISWWGKEAAVSLQIDNETITRIRGKTRNVYIDSSNNEISPETSVPEFVNTILNIRPDINIQHQIGSPFLLQSSPGQVAQFFNSVAGISAIDTSIKYAKNKVSTFEKALNHNTKEYERIENDLKSYEYLKDLEKEVVELEKTHTEYVKTINKETKLSKLLNDLDSTYLRQSSFKGRYKALPEINDILTNDVPVLKEMETFYLNLKKVVDQLKKKQVELEIKAKSVKALWDQFKSQMPDQCPLCGVSKKSC